MKKCVYARFSGKHCRGTGSYVIGVNERAILEVQHGNYLCKKHVVASAKSMGLVNYTEIREKELSDVSQ